MTRFRDTLHRTSQALTSSYETEFGRDQIPLTAQQFSVLEALWELDGPAQTTLVELTGIDRSTMADIMLRLVKKGFVARRRDGRDRRRYVLAITTKGKEVTLRAQIIANRIDASVALGAPTAMKGIEGRLKAIIGSVGTRSSLVAAE